MVYVSSLVVFSLSRTSAQGVFKGVQRMYNYKYAASRYSLAQEASTMADQLQPPHRRISRRAVVRQLAGLAVVGLTGGGVVYLAHTQISPNASSPRPLPATVPVQPIGSSAIMFGFDAQHSHYNPNEHILSPANVSQLALYWSASTDGPIVSSPAVAKGIVYIGSSDWSVYAFDASTGKVRWSSPTGGPIDSSPAVANGIVYVGSADHRLYVFEASDGGGLWTTITGSSISSSPICTNRVVY